MKKFFIVPLSLVWIFFMSASSAFAQATGPASVYKVTLTKMEMFNGTSFITVFSGTSTTIDIASVNAGAAAGNFIGGASIPDGTYTKVKVTASATFIISGNVGTDYTTAAKAGTPLGCVPGNAAAEAECTVDIDGGVAAEEHTFSTPITVTNGVPTHKVRVSFDVSAAIQNLGGNLYPAAPTITLSVIAL